MSVSTDYEHLYFHLLIIATYDLGYENTDKTTTIVQIIKNQKM